LDEVVAKGYRPVLRDQPFLMPVDMREWLPADHLVWFVLEVVDQLDTSAFHRRAKKLKATSGRAGCDPDLLAGLLLYAYCRGVRSSRQIERLCEVDVAFRIACAGDVPDHSVIARFRQNHDKAFADLFVQVLRLAAKAGLGRFGTIAIDGTKIAANASVDANRTEAWLREQVANILTEAQQVDAAEDAEHGDRRGDEPPEDLADPAARAVRIRAALAEIEAERAAAEQTAAGKAAEQMAQVEAGHQRLGGHPAGIEVAVLGRRLERLVTAQQAKLEAFAVKVAAAEAAGQRGPRGRPPAPVERHNAIVTARARLAAAHARAAERTRRQAEKTAATPAKANLTDPGSRLMPTRRGWVQGYNVQVAVTGDQLIVATRVGQNTVDVQQFLPMVAAAEQAAAGCRAATGREDIAIGVALADAGYFSQANLTTPGPDRLIAVGKGSRQHNDAVRRPAAGEPPPGASAGEAMDHRLRTADGAELYKRRGATVEPAIGNLKKIITRFSRRGLHAATGEIDLAAAAFNLLKLHRAGLATA
jgi:transposase